MKPEYPRLSPIPFISVIVPVWNGERYLREMADSITAQAVRNLEVIVVDDGSVDATPEIIRALSGNFRYFRKEHTGIADSLNLGLEQARGDLFAFLDSDDRWSSNSLALRIEALEQNPEAGMATGYVQQFHSPELDPQIRQQIHCPAEPLPGYVLGALLVRRPVLEKVGNFSQRFQFTPAVDWFIRAKDLDIPLVVRPEVVLHRRLHDRNISHQKVQAGTIAEILRHSLNRRRQPFPSDRLTK